MQCSSAPDSQNAVLVISRRLTLASNCTHQFSTHQRLPGICQMFFCFIFVESPLLAGITYYKYKKRNCVDMQGANSLEVFTHHQQLA